MFPLLQAYPDKKFTWLDRIAVAAQEQPRGSIERQRLTDDIHSSINLLRKFRPLRMSDTKSYKDVYEEAWSEVWSWLLTGVAREESKLNKDKDNNIPGVEVWDPEQAWGKDKKNIGLSFTMFFKNRFKWTLMNLWQHHTQNAECLQDDDEFMNTLLDDGSDDDEEANLPMIQVLKKVISEPKTRAYMESKRMNCKRDVTLLHIVENVLEFHITAQEKGWKYTQTELWPFVGVNLEVIPNTAYKFFGGHVDNLKKLLEFNESEDEDE
jgi:hypothetical protein